MAHPLQIPTTEIIHALAHLGGWMHEYTCSQDDFSARNTHHPLENTLIEAERNNAWFTGENVFFALNEWAKLLQHGPLAQWLTAYPGLQMPHARKTVAVVMAGNIPLVGFHDFLCILLAGHKAFCKLSADDDVLLPALASELIKALPALSANLEFAASPLRDFDAVIATGSNNSARYFEYYFGKYPHIIRKNRHGVAVIDGHEDEATLQNLGNDLNRYFGLGCRNVSKIWIPEDMDTLVLQKITHHWNERLAMHHKFMNNHDYYRSLYLLNRTPFVDAACCMFVENESLATPVSVVHYQRYAQPGQAIDWIGQHADEIQCVVSSLPEVSGSIAPGKSQSPGLTDYADGVDVMSFLSSL